MRWMIILRTSFLILPDKMMPFWSMWRTNTVPNIEESLSLTAKMSGMAATSPLASPLDLVIRFLIHIIRPARLKNTEHLSAWLKGHPDKAITQHCYWPPQGSLRILCLKRWTTGGKLIRSWLIITPIPWRLAVHFGDWISLPGGASEWKHIQSMPISPMWQQTCSLFYHMVSESRPVTPFGERVVTRDSLQPLVGHLQRSRSKTVCWSE